MVQTIFRAGAYLDILVNVVKLVRLCFCSLKFLRSEVTLLFLTFCIWASLNAEQWILSRGNIASTFWVSLTNPATIPGNWTSVLRQKLLFLCRHRQFYEPHMQSHWWFVYGWCEQLFVRMLARFHWRFLWDKLALKAYYSTNHTSNCRKVKTEVISTNYLLIFLKTSMTALTTLVLMVRCA